MIHNACDSCVSRKPPSRTSLVCCVVKRTKPSSERKYTEAVGSQRTDWQSDSPSLSSKYLHNHAGSILITLTQSSRGFNRSRRRFSALEWGYKSSGWSGYEYERHLHVFGDALGNVRIIVHGLRKWRGFPDSTVIDGSLVITVNISPGTMVE